MERACQDRSGQQGSAERGPQRAPSLGAVGVTWKKSSWSAHNGNCVEVAALSASIGVRDSKDASSPILIFDRGAWSQFLVNAKNGRYDLS
jgi:Domain of unknown function (DUF397)